MKKSFDELILESDTAIKGTLSSLVANLGKVVATITIFVASLITFTDITLTGFHTKGYLGTLILMVLCAYVMYFSLLDVGEKKGEESDEFKSAKARYTATRVKITGDMMPALRAFCEEYSRCDLESRKRNRLMSYGYSKEDISTSDFSTDKRKKRAFRRTQRLRAQPLTPRMLLSFDKQCSGELNNPERGKLLRSFIRLLPSAVCMCVTVSVALSIKDGMSLTDAINGALKLSTLPIIGVRGYTAGIVYSTVTKSAWLETKSRILENFLSSELV